MTTNRPSEILDGLRSLVSNSCSDESGAVSSFSSLHKGIIKLYFEARKVDIDYEKALIKAEIPMSGTEYTTVCFECQDLETFLKSCLRKDKRSLLFYQNVLTYYGNMSIA